MEKGIKDFFIKVTNSIAIFLLWVVINAIVGLYLGWALFSDGPTWKNWIYYIFAAGTFILVILFLIKKWKDGLPNPDDESFKK